MIKVPTVLILGAGSSAHLGYPLGSELISEICRGSKVTGKDEILPGKWKSSDLEDFTKRLRRSGHYSIDAFLEENPKHLELGRYLITRQLKACEHIESLFERAGWYQYLFNKLISGGVERIGENPISIITFNYDRSLECYLHEAIQNRSQLSSEDATKVLRSIQIIHVHGILGSYPEIPYTPEASPDDLFSVSHGIKIIHELQDAPTGFCSAEFEAANACLQGAERIIFLGFGFHADNVRRFQFFTPKAVKNKELKAAVAGIGSAALAELVTRLEAFGFVRENFDGHTCDHFFGNCVPLR